jgi:hypothetical protein
MSGDPDVARFMMRATNGRPRNDTLLIAGSMTRSYALLNEGLNGIATNTWSLAS